MKGFEATFRGKTINVAPKFGTSIFIYQRHGYFHVDVLGLEEKDGETISHKWIDSDLEIGESIEIEIKNINSPSESIKTHIAFSNSTLLTNEERKEMLKEKLDIFSALEKLLKGEGLI